MPLNDPLTWDRQIRLLADFDDQYQSKLKTDPQSADPSGPFVGVPPITQRAAFAQLRELPDNLPLRRPMQRWAYRLTDSRVNATIQRQIAQFWRGEPISIDFPQRISTTRSELITQVLSNSRGRSQWLSALQNQLGAAAEVTSELWQRKEELAKRAGFQGVISVIDPVPDMHTLCDEWLTLSAAISVELLPREFDQLLEVALANPANQGWPARISGQSVAGLLGGTAWFRHVTVREPDWPRLIGPTSFMRALHRLGQELARARAPADYPFVIAHDPWHLAEHRLGSLLASLVLNDDWQLRVLRLRKDHARAQAHMLMRSVLQASRGLCLRLRLRIAAIQSSDVLRSAFAEHTVGIFGFELPEQFAGQLPRIDPDDAQRLLGLWLGLSDHARLIQIFDEDWYRNPRAVETVLGELLGIGELAPTTKLCREDLPIAARWLVSRYDS